MSFIFLSNVHPCNLAELICSTIRSEKESAEATIIVMQATFISPVAGTIYFRQSGNESTVFHGKLFWVNEMNTADVEWDINFQEGLVS